MTTASKIAQELPTLSIADRQRFYAHLAHELTIEVRVVWSNDDLGGESKIELMKHINELQHRVLGKLLALQAGKDSWPEADFIKMVQTRAKNAEVQGGVGRAMKAAWQRIATT